MNIKETLQYEELMDKLDVAIARKVNMIATAKKQGFKTDSLEASLKSHTDVRDRASRYEGVHIGLTILKRHFNLFGRTTETTNTI